jgi:hypothetical protein
VLSLDFAEIMVLHRDILALPFRCPEDRPKVSIVDNQKDGYSLKLKKSSAKECCHGCCVKELIENRNLRVTEDENYLTFR